MLLECRNVTVSYPQSGTILDRLNLQIHENEFIAIAGRAGCGKTTLLDTLGGLHKPNGGTVFFQNEDIYGSAFDRINFRRQLQIVFQFPENQFFENDIRSEVAFGPKMLKLSQDETERRVMNALKMSGLDNIDAAVTSPFILSGGQKRRLALACALALEPKILLLDEPFSGLDAEGQRLLSETLRNLHKNGMTILMISHDPDTVCELADRVIVLHNGKIACDGKPEQVYSDSENCHSWGIGQPSVKKLADRIGLNLSDSYRYTDFLKSLEKKLAGETHD